MIDAPGGNTAAPAEGGPSRSVDAFFTAVLLVAALLLTLNNAGMKRAPDAPRQDAFAHSLERMKGLGPQAPFFRAFGLWIMVSLVVAGAVGARVVAKRLRGEKTPDLLAEPPPWGVTDFTVIFVASFAWQMIAMSQLPRLAVVLDDGRRVELAKPVSLGPDIEVVKQEGAVRLKSAAGVQLLSPGDSIDVGGVRGHVEGPSTIAFLLAVGAGSLGAPLLVLAGLRLRAAPFAELGLRGFHPDEAVRGLVGYLAMIPGVLALTAVSSALCRALDVPMVEHPLLKNMGRMRGDELALLFVVAAVIAPVSEEILFRGYFLRALRRPIPSRGLAIVAASFFFGAFHPGLSSLLPITWVGSVFAILFLSSPRRSLLSNMVCHALFNGVEIGFAYWLAHS